jgi:hypothetical protein
LQLSFLILDNAVRLEIWSTESFFQHPAGLSREAEQNQRSSAVFRSATTDSLTPPF